MASGPAAISSLACSSLGALHHGAELDDLEGPAPLADAGLAEQHRLAVAHADGDRHRGHDRRQQHQGGRRDDHVEGALGRAGDPARAPAADGEHAHAAEGVDRRRGADQVEEPRDDVDVHAQRVAGAQGLEHPVVGARREGHDHPVDPLRLDDLAQRRPGRRAGAGRRPRSTSRRRPRSPPRPGRAPGGAAASSATWRATSPEPRMSTRCGARRRALSAICRPASHAKGAARVMTVIWARSIPQPAKAPMGQMSQEVRIAATARRGKRPRPTGFCWARP